MARTKDTILEASSSSGCEFPWPWPAAALRVVAGELERDAEAMEGGGMDRARAGASLGASRRLGAVHGKQEVARGVGGVCMQSTEQLRGVGRKTPRWEVGWAGWAVA